MLKDKAIALLKVHPEEVRMVTLMAALFLCLQAGQGIGENAVFGLLLGQGLLDQLPYLYMALGALVSVLLLAYATSLSRFQDSNVVSYVMAVAVFLFGIQWVATTFFGFSSYSLLWLTTRGMGVLSGTALWTIAGEVCDARQAKRLFPLFTSVGILGSVLGNLLTGFFATIAGTANLVALCAVLFGAGYFLTRQITRSYFRVEVGVARYSLVSDMRGGFDFVRGSQLFRLVALAAILLSILSFTFEFPFNEVASDYFERDEARLAGFKGLLSSITTAATFLVSLLLANRFYTRFGIIGSILILPVAYAVGFLVFFASFSLGGGVVTNFSQMVILQGLVGTAWSALFNVVPADRRGQVLAFNNGVPAQLGVFVAGALISISKQLFETRDILLLGAFFAVVTVYLTLKMKPAYGEALLNALRAGRVDVFNDRDESFAGYQNDPAAMQVIHNALRDPKAHIRRLAVEISARTGNRDVIPDLVDRLYDDDGSVRAAATRAVADLGGHAALGDVILGLDDPDREVRVETLASLPKLGVDLSPELIRTLERLLKDRDAGVKAHAAFVLLALGHDKSAQSLLTRMFRNKDAEKRRIVLRSFGHVAENLRGAINVRPEFLLDALHDESLPVRREATRVARYLREETVIRSLADLLADEDLTVRRTASESLKQLWPESRGVILEKLEDLNGSVVYAALSSIPSGEEDLLPSLRGYIQREVSNIRYLRSLIDSLPRQGRVVSLLLDTLIIRESKSEERLIKAVGLFGNPRALELIRKSLNVGDASTRSSALEALETLGDRKIIQDVLPILDRGGVFHKSDEYILDIVSTIGILLADQDHWLRALAARAVPELGLSDCLDVLKHLKKDRHPLVRQAAGDALKQMDGTKMKTLKTLSTLDRILLLREVPMFSGVAPEDLERIADIAHEQVYAARGLICREGDPGDSLFIIVSGDVEVVKSAGNEEHILAMRGAGEFLGEMAIIESAPRSATLRAVNDVRLLSIEGDAFKSILLDRPQVAVSALQNMSARIRALNERIGAG